MYLKFSNDCNCSDKLAHTSKNATSVFHFILATKSEFAELYST